MARIREQKQGMNHQVLREIYFVLNWIKERNINDKPNNKKNCGRHMGPVLHKRQVVFTRF